MPSNTIHLVSIKVEYLEMVGLKEVVNLFLEKYSINFIDSILWAHKSLSFEGDHSPKKKKNGHEKWK